jgi:hypothetical protein
MRKTAVVGALAALLFGVSVAHAEGLSSPGGIAVGAANYHDWSAAVLLGGQAQNLMEANPRRRGCFFQNVSAGDLWLNILGGVAAPARPSMFLPPGAVYECPTNGASAAAFSIFGAFTAQSFTAYEW